MRWCLLFISLLLSFNVMAQDRVVNVYVWAGEIPSFVVKDFEKKTGIKVNFSSFENNEVMYAKLRANAKNGYDVILPSGYFIERMRKQDMLEPLDKSKLSHFKNIDPSFLSAAYDPAARYSVPHIWGITGIFLNKQYFSRKDIRHWSQLWEKRFYNQLMLIDDMREVFAISLISLGYSPNDTDPEHIKQAFLKLKDLQKNIKVYSSDTLISIMIDEDANIGMGWNGDAFKAYSENPNIDFILPKEGFVMWVDAFAIPKTAPHKDEAYAFINYLLDAEVNKNLILAIGYPTANLAGRKLLPEKIRNNPIIYPSKDTMRRAQFQSDLGADTIELYEKYWEELKLGS